jgi:hypothetical protein
MAASTAIVISSTVKLFSASSSVVFPLYECLRKVPHQSLRDEIDQVRSCWFHLLLLSTLIVAVGVAVEGIEHLMSAGKPYVDAESGDFQAAPRTKLRKQLERLGWLLVVVGVIGEGIFEAATSSVDDMLQGFNSTMLALATEQAGGAAKSAARAKASADAAGVVAGDALSKSKTANDAAGKALNSSKAATEAASKAQEQVDIVAERAVEIDKDLWQTQYFLSARSLIDAHTLVGTLKKFKGKNVDLMSVVGDPEGYFLCNSLLFAAQSAEMKPIDNCGKRSPSPPNQTGIFVYGPDAQDTKELGNIIANAVNPGGAGITVGGSMLSVFVGRQQPFMMDKKRAFTPPQTKKQTNKTNAKP